MNGLDLLILIPILAGLIKGLLRGFVSEIITFVVIIFGALGARLLAPPVSAFIQSAFNWPAGTCDVVTYIVLFIASAVLISIIAKQLNRFISAIHLSWVNHLLGGLMGAAKILLIVLIVVFALERTNDEYHYLDDAPIVQQSVLYPTVAQLTHDLFTFSREQFGQS